MDVFDLCAKLRLDTNEYEKSLNGASENSKSFASKLGNGLKTAGKVAGVALTATATAIGAVSARIGEGIASTAQYGDNIDKMSQKLGISAEAYQEWDFIAQHSGTTVDGLQASMKTLSNAVQDGSDKQVEAFKAIGLSMDDVAKMSTEELFSNVITGLQGMEEGTQRTAIASSLLGRSATELGALLNTSAEDTQKMRDQAHELGAVLSDEAVSASANFQDSLQNLQASISGLQNGAFAELLPSVTTVMDGLTAVMSGDDNGINMIAKGVGELSDKLMEALPKVAEFGLKMIKTLGESIISNLPTIVNTGFEIVKQLTDMILQNLPMLIETGLQIILELAMGIADALPTLIPTIVDVVLNIVDTLINNVDLLIDGAIALMIGLADGMVNAMPQIAERIPEIILKITEALIANAPKLLSASLKLVITLADGLVQYWSTLISKIPQLVTQIVEKFKTLASNWKEIGKNMVAGLWEGFKDRWNKLIEDAKGLGTKLLSILKELLGIHSPSRVFRQMAEYCVEGFQIGFSDFADGSLLDGVQDKLNALQIPRNELDIGISEEYTRDITANQSITVVLQGDADRLFRLVREQSSKNVILTGQPSF